MMRKALLAVAFLAACSKGEATKDTTSAMQAGTATPAPPPPAAVKGADIAGTWNGESKAAGKDSVVGKWTVTNTSDSTGSLKFTDANGKNAGAVDFKTTFDADSFVALSGPYNDPSMPKGAPKVTFRSVGHLKDGKMMGVAELRLATKADSVLGKVDWTATKAP